jgi:hypothetical protein
MLVTLSAFAAKRQSGAPAGVAKMPEGEDRKYEFVLAV